MVKIILLGIVFQCLNTLSGSSFDTISKLLGSKSYYWYHIFGIGNTFGLVLFFIFLYFNGGIKNHIILKNKTNYIIPLLRGLTMIPIPIFVFISLKHVPLNVFTTLLMTSPFFIFIFSQIIQKEKVTYINWIILFIGFVGVVFVIKPNPANLNIYIFLVLYVSAYNSLSNVILSKYSKLASSYGYTFYHFAPMTIVSMVIFLFDPVQPPLKELIMFLGLGMFLMLSILFWTAAFHIAGKYSGIVSPFIFTQIIWASIYGYLFFNEYLDFIGVIGICLIVLSGTIAIRQTKSIT